MNQYSIISLEKSVMPTYPCVNSNVKAHVHDTCCAWVGYLKKICRGLVRIVKDHNYFQDVSP